VVEQHLRANGRVAGGFCVRDVGQILCLDSLSRSW
jgi:hypothetical protein